MNLCFVLGKIISNIKFEFILNSANISIAIFYIELSNGCIIKVKGYNEIADFCYRKLEKEINVFIKGYINSKVELIIDYIEIIDKNIAEK